MPRNTLFADDGNVQDFAKLVNAKTRNLYPVSEYGALGNGVADDRQAIIDAVSAAILTDGAIVLTGKHRVASALTVNVPIVFTPGATLKPDSSVNIDLYGELTISSPYVFDQTAGGTVYPHNMRWLPSWWGDTGTSNDTPAWFQMSRANSVYSALPAKPVIIEVTGASNRFIGIQLVNATIEAAGGHSVNFYPPVGHSGTDDYMVRLMGKCVVNGGTWDSEGVSNIRLIQVAQARTHIQNAYFLIQGNTATYGVYVEDVASITPRVTGCLFHGGNGTGTAIFMGSSDAEITNVWIGKAARGITDIKGSGTYINCHIWECSEYGMQVLGGSRVIGCYIETNLGWGLIMRANVGTIVSSCRFWANGHGIPNTGGVIMSGFSSGGANVNCNSNTIDNCIFDDNVGVGLLIERTNHARVTASIMSTRAIAGNTPSSNYGVKMDDLCRNTKLDISCPRAMVIDGAINDLGSRNTMQTLGKSSVVKRDVLDLPEGNTNFLLYMSRWVEPGSSYTFSGYVVVRSADSNGLRIRFQCPTVSTGRWETSHNNVVNTLPASGGGTSTLADGSNTLKTIAFTGTFTTGSGDDSLKMHLSRANAGGTGVVEIVEGTLTLERIG